MDLTALHACPHLLSPAALAAEDTDGRWWMVPHLRLINEALMDAAFTDGSRTLINCPYQHGKTMLAAKYFPAWYLLLFPHKRIVLVSRDDEFAAAYGADVKDVVEKFGKPLGVKLREDTRSKNTWKVADHGGGMISRGCKGGVVGNPADLFLIDDLISTPEQALSKAILDGHWNFYQTVVFSRLRRVTSLVIIGTRWCKGDIFGRFIDQARQTGRAYRHLKFKAIAEEDDICGRQPGEALWPDQVPLEHLLEAKKTNRWWSAGWQQDPEDEEGAFFHPRRWPRWTDLGDAISVPTDYGRQVYLKRDLLLLITVDWARSKKSTADYTAMVVFYLTPCGKLLLLDVVNRRLALSELAPALAALCGKYRPGLVAVETGHPTLYNEVRDHEEIPEVRWLKPQGTDKRLRALPAQVMGDNGKILLPRDTQEWEPDFVRQVANFDGLTDEHDDMVDALAYGATIAQELRVPRRLGGSGSPGVLTAGKEVF